jgi:hypothetical protein
MSHPFQVVDKAVSHAAKRKLASAQPDQLLADLRSQGIGDLNALVTKTIEAANRSLAGGALDDEINQYCYKFTTYHPVFGTIVEGDPEQFAAAAKQIEVDLKQAVAGRAQQRAT